MIQFQENTWTEGSMDGRTEGNIKLIFIGSFWLPPRVQILGYFLIPKPQYKIFLKEII